ncbi:pre-mRNA-splicing factor CWC22 [Planoprotostelium fungivorum]|uniref:Pre-mRNA-splicing factor CWC22 n=1 Tax=Planoprotostelium fungivorum TaxID=1890364 RepID=A0A2P6NKR6_9EUKA|nr:pre-mRNA-splicing factor CWC22 [Planoprotostelium fungivorum]
MSAAVDSPVPLRPSREEESGGDRHRRAPDVARALIETEEEGAHAVLQEIEGEEILVVHLPGIEGAHHLEEAGETRGVLHLVIAEEETIVQIERGDVAHRRRVTEPKSEPRKIVQEINNGKAGGIYIPPFRLAQMKRETEDKSSLEYQRMSWEALKKSINGLINKVSVGNIKHLIEEIFYENIVRGRGLFCRSAMRAQSSSTTFTNVYAAMIAIINTKMPELGNLVIRRLVLNFKKAFNRNDRAGCTSSILFIGHLFNQQMVNVLLPLQIVALLLGSPTDDSVELSVAFLIECGAMLSQMHPKGFNQIFDRLRAILHEGAIDKKVQYSIESLFEVRKKNFADHPPVKPDLDLVDAEDQYVHDISLDAALEPETNLDFFHADENFVENEEKYKVIREEILGADTVEELEGRRNGVEYASDEEEEAGEATGEGAGEVVPQDSGKIQDNTETDMMNFRRIVYLTIMSAASHEECCHKILKIQMKPGQELELCNMLIECCCQEKSYMRFYGLVGQRFCEIDKTYRDAFEKCFLGQYSTIHRLETNKLRNVAKFFAHLLHSDGLSWEILQVIHLNEEETTSAGRIFIKIVFQELTEFLGLSKLNARLRDPGMQQFYAGLFPRENAKDSRFAINFFTYIGLGGLTEDLREHLKNAPKRMLEKEEESSDDDSSSSSSSSSSDSDSSSSDSDSSDSDDDRRKKRRR